MRPTHALYTTLGGFFCSICYRFCMLHVLHFFECIEQSPNAVQHTYLCTVLIGKRNAKYLHEFFVCPAAFKPNQTHLGAWRPFEILYSGSMHYSAHLPHTGVPHYIGSPYAAHPKRSTSQVVTAGYAVCTSAVARSRASSGSEGGRRWRGVGLKMGDDRTEGSRWPLVGRLNKKGNKKLRVSIKDQGALWIFEGKEVTHRKKTIWAGLTV